VCAYKTPFKKMKSVLRYLGSVYTSSFPCEWNIAEDGSVECIHIAQCDEEELDEESKIHAQTIESLLAEVSKPQTKMDLVQESVLSYLSSGPKRSQDVIAYLVEAHSFSEGSAKKYAYRCVGIEKRYGMWQLQKQLQLSLPEKDNETSRTNEQGQESDS